MINVRSSQIELQNAQAFPLLLFKAIVLNDSAVVSGSRAVSFPGRARRGGDLNEDAYPL